MRCYVGGSRSTPDKSCDVLPPLQWRVAMDRALFFLLLLFRMFNWTRNPFIYLILFFHTRINEGQAGAAQSPL